VRAAVCTGKLVWNLDDADPDRLENLIERHWFPASSQALITGDNVGLHNMRQAIPNNPIMSCCIAAETRL